MKGKLAGRVSVVLDVRPLREATGLLSGAAQQGWQVHFASRLTAALKAASDATLADAKAMAPMDTGALRNSFLVPLKFAHAWMAPTGHAGATATDGGEAAPVIAEPGAEPQARGVRRVSLSGEL